MSARPGSTSRPGVGADGYPASDPRQAEPGMLHPAEPPTTGEVWAKASLKERVRGWCLDITGNGNAFPYVVYVYVALKCCMYLGLFYLCIDPSKGYFTELNVKRFIVYNTLTDALGMNATNGPLGFRCKLPFVSWWNFLTPGTITSTLMPGFLAVRRWWMVALYVAYIALLGKALIADSIGLNEVGPPLACLTILLPFDLTVFLASRGEYFVYMLVALCFEKDWLFGCQCVQIGLWTWAGVSKLGPWFKHVTGNMTPNCQFLRVVPWVVRALYVDLPRDCSPSNFCKLLAAFGTVQELIIGPLCACPSYRMIGCGWSIMFHTYIFSMFPFASVMEWNIACILLSTYFFGYNEVDLSLNIHPCLGGFLVLVMLLIPFYGQFIDPKKIPFLLGFRPYAGNWRFSTHVIAKSAVPKVNKLKTFESPIASEAFKSLPGGSLRFAEQIDYFVMAQVMLFPSYRPFVPILDRLFKTKGRKMDDFHFPMQESWFNSVLGWSLGVGWHNRPPLYRALKHVGGFEPGDYFVVYCDPMPLFSRKLKWVVVDVGDPSTYEKGYMSGWVDYADLESVQPWDFPDSLLNKKEQ
eukprot:Hpha_TRINITY_DN13309_c0_g1::TRINITY_DN13309_c0_g1_i1::g.95675::m.95675